jgi:hypothetical protein
MTSVYNDILSLEDLAYVNALPEVLEAKQEVDRMPCGKVSFTIPQKNSLRTALFSKLGLDLRHLDKIPMQWIKGDMVAHVDSGASTFERTYLVYLTSCSGEFVVDTNSYPIVKNTAYVFNEGLSHKTENTGSTLRLLLGPVSEKGFRVGVRIKMYYYPTYQDALNFANIISTSDLYTIYSYTPPGGGQAVNWKISSNSTGSSSPTNVYAPGDVLNDDGIYYLYIFAPPPPPVMLYYPTLNDALAETNVLATSDNYVINNYIGANPMNKWKIASNSTGSSSKTNVYVTDDNLDSHGTYYLYQYNPDPPPKANNVYYYSTAQDAIDMGKNELASADNYTVGSYFGADVRITWRIASNSTGSSSTATVYKYGDVLNGDGTYYLYISLACFLEGTKILCEVDGKEVYVPIEDLRCGSFVKTSRDGYKRIECIGKGALYNPANDERTENRLYKCSPNAYSELTEDLYITGCHSILVDTVTYTEKAEILKSLGRIFITDKKYRLMASIDARAQPWNCEGTYTIWHFALENADIRMNYGVYANGLLVESCSINAMKTKSNLSLLPLST